MQTSKLSDEQLVEIIREKDKELYSEIIKRYQTKLSHYLRKFVHNPDELEDVLQVAFIKAYRNLFGFNIHKKFSSWIYRIAHNEAVNHLKKNFKGQISLEEVEYKIIDEKINLHEQVDKNLLREKIEKCLNDIKLKYREPLILFFFEQKSYQEISDILHISKNTVGTLISRAKQMLKENLIQQENYER